MKFMDLDSLDTLPVKIRLELLLLYLQEISGCIQNCQRVNKELIGHSPAFDAQKEYEAFAEKIKTSIVGLLTNSQCVHCGQPLESAVAVDTIPPRLKNDAVSL